MGLLGGDLSVKRLRIWRDVRKPQQNLERCCWGNKLLKGAKNILLSLYILSAYCG